LGALIIGYSIVAQYEIGLRIGVVTLIFGGVLRVLNIVGKAIPTQNRKNPTSILFLLSLLKFSLWIIVLFLYFVCINKILPIF